MCLYVKSALPVLLTAREKLLCPSLLTYRTYLCYVQFYNGIDSNLIHVKSPNRKLSLNELHNRKVFACQAPPLDSGSLCGTPTLTRRSLSPPEVVLPHIAGCRGGGRMIAISVDDNLFALQRHLLDCCRHSVLSKSAAARRPAIASPGIIYGVEGTRVPRAILPGGLGHRGREAARVEG